jgi:hypothetical protein
MLLNTGVKLTSQAYTTVTDSMSLNTDEFHTSQLYQNMGTTVDSINNVIHNLNHKNIVCNLNTAINPSQNVANGDTLVFVDKVSDPFQSYDNVTGVITCPIDGMITIRLNGSTNAGGMDFRIIVQGSSAKGDVNSEIFRTYLTGNSYQVSTNYAYVGNAGDKIKLVVSTTATVSLPYSFQMSITWG